MTTTDPEKLRLKRLRKVERQKASGVYQAKQKRKYERQKTQPAYMARRKAHDIRKHNARAMARQFIAWDGEGVTVCKACRQPWWDGQDVCEMRDDALARCGGTEPEHIYILLRNSVGDSIRGTAEAPLTTKSCINLILHTAFLHPGAIHVAYAFDYDVNMILADCTEDDLRLIRGYDGNAGVFTRSAGAVVNYRPHKMTRFSRTIHGKRYSCTIFDLFTFEHRSFVKCCDRYLGDDWPHREAVVAGKGRRSSFTADDIEEIDRYCGYELEAMVLFAEELRSRLDDAGLRPATWNGPGAVASRVLQKHGIKQHLPSGLAPIEWPHSQPQFMAFAYSGGRFELFRYGVMQEPVWRYDIHSAYPWAMTLLPSLAGGRWHYVRGSQVGGIQPFCLYHVHWRSRQSDGSRPQPFHHRHPNGNVCYPYETEGWYWAPEVEMALRYAALDGHCDMQIKEAYIFEPANDLRPFSFMQEYYEERAKLKAAGHPAELAYKLAINSVYGKLIQQLGWNKDTGKAPPWFCLQWGGLITSYTRAALMGAVMDNKGLDDLISFETDAIFTRKQYSMGPSQTMDLSDSLGAWEETKLDSLTYLQSGFYAGTIAGEPFGKTRGRTADTVNVTDPTQFGADIAQCILDRRPYKYTLHGFVGMGAALNTDFGRWRQWVDMPREVEPPDVLVETSSKRVHDIVHCSCDVESGGTMAGRWHTTFVPPILSTGPQRPYEIAWEGRTERDELWEEM